MTNSYNNRNSSTESVEVTQADRDAAAATIPPDIVLMGINIRDATVGGRNDDSDIVQAFARHRQSSIPNEVVKALEAVDPYLDAIVCYASTMAEHEPNRIAAEYRAALASLKERNQ